MSPLVETGEATLVTGAGAARGKGDGVVEDGGEVLMTVLCE